MRRLLFSIPFLLASCSGADLVAEPSATTVATSSTTEETTQEATPVETTATQSTLQLPATVADAERRTRPTPSTADAEAADAEAQWLSEQLPLNRLVVGEGLFASEAFAIDAGSLTTIDTGGAYVMSDGSYLFLDVPTETTHSTRVFDFDGNLVCTAEARLSATLEDTATSLTFVGTVQRSSSNQPLVYDHQVDVNCTSGVTVETQPLKVDAPDAWQESKTLVRTGDREFLLKQAGASSVASNEEGVRIDGTALASDHAFSPDGSVLVHTTAAAREPQVQARDTDTGELLWEISVVSTVSSIIVTDDWVLVDVGNDDGRAPTFGVAGLDDVDGIDSTDGVDGIVLIDLHDGTIQYLVETTMRLVGGA